jgi:formylmethanofuran dehydrogenase subunit E
MAEPEICGLSLAEFFVRMEEFHGYRSPGLLVGGIMLDVSLQELGPTPYLNVVTETVVCLPDAVQLLTPCTMGNGFLQVLDWGKFALTSYDRLSLSGVRIWLNPDALVGHPVIRRWFQRSKGTAEKPLFEELASEILTAGQGLLSHRPVRLHHALKDSQRIPTGRCPDCGESYALRLGPACPACSGEAYYDYQVPDKGPTGG